MDQGRTSRRRTWNTRTVSENIYGGYSFIPNSEHLEGIFGFERLSLEHSDIDVSLRLDALSRTAFLYKMTIFVIKEEIQSNKMIANMMDWKPFVDISLPDQHYLWDGFIILCQNIWISKLTCLPPFVFPI